MRNKDYILEKLGQEEVLAQLEEECAELIKAASKLRRSMSKKNPTPVTTDEARKMLLEEFADVLLCMDILGYKPDEQAVLDIQQQKEYRWVSRINQQKGD